MLFVFWTIIIIIVRLLKQTKQRMRLLLEFSPNISSICFLPTLKYLSIVCFFFWFLLIIILLHVCFFFSHHSWHWGHLHRLNGSTVNRASKSLNSFLTLFFFRRWFSDCDVSICCETMYAIRQSRSRSCNRVRQNNISVILLFLYLYNCDCSYWNSMAVHREPVVKKKSF